MMTHINERINVAKDCKELDIKIIPVSLVEYVAKAKRPCNSRMSKNELEENGGDRLPTLQDAFETLFERNL